MHTQYIHFTEEQKQTARQIDIAEMLRSQGETVKRSGSEYEWRDGSAKVTIRGNLWFHQYERQGGDAIDFVRRFYNKSYPEAMEYLLGDSNGALVTSPPVVKEMKPFELPAPNNNMRRAFAYLNITRGIDKDVLQAFIHRKMIYESAYYHNAVFVGYDRNNIPRHAHKRGTATSSSYKKEIRTAVCRNIRFTGMAQASISVYFKHRLICSVLSPCTKRTGKGTVMLPAAV